MLQYSPQTKLYRGDQSDGEFLSFVLSDSDTEFDIVVDDGSHDPEHQLFTFDALFPSVKPGGLYIFEDVETSYWNEPGAGLYERRFKQPLGIGSANSVIERFKSVVDGGRNMNGLFVGPESRREWEEEAERSGTRMRWQDEIAEVSFAQNLIVVRKADEADDWFYTHVRRGEYVHHLETH